MDSKHNLSRRRFMGGAAAALGYLGLRPGSVMGASLPRAPKGLAPLQARDDYDSLVKLSSNENPYGPSDAMLEAMNSAWKYSNRYGYPDGNIQEKIAEHHGVKPENILLGAGSGETLKVAGHAFLGHNKKVIGVEPTYTTVYQVASHILVACLSYLHNPAKERIPFVQYDNRPTHLCIHGLEHGAQFSYSADRGQRV